MCGVHVSEYVCPVKVKENVKAIVPVEESRREGRKGEGKEEREKEGKGGKRGGREGRREEIFHGEES